jgi:hypothetical protein
MKRNGQPAIILLIAAVLAGAPGRVHAQDETDSVSVDRVKPVLKSFVTGRDVNITLGSRMATTIDPGGGWKLTNSLSHEIITYRARDMEEVRNSLTNTASKMISGALAFNFDIGRDFRKKQTLGLARYGKDLIIEDEGAGFGLLLMQPILGTKNSAISFMGRGSRGLKDFKYDKTLQGSASAHLGYAVGDLLNISGGAGLFRRRETSRVETIEYSDMPSKADTFNVNVNYGRTTSKILKFSYKTMVGIDRRVMPPRGNSLEIIDAPELSVQEESRVSAQEIKMTSALRPLSYFDIDLAFDHNINSQKNRVDTRLSKEPENSALHARTAYQYAATGKATINVSTTKSKTDYGPTSISSFEDREYKINMGIRQKVSEMLSLSFSGAASHKQRFFLKKDANPRDADYLHYRGDAGLKATPFTKFSTQVSFVADRYEVINIDGTLSGDNRVDYLYWAVPKYTYTPANWLKISQDFTIKIEFTDFVHKEQENYLNRTTALKTFADITIFPSLKFKFTHNYLMRDTGSYTYKEKYIGDEPVIDRSERLYNPTSENLEYGIRLELRYQPSSEFRMWAGTDFQDKRSNRLRFKEGSSDREVIPITAYGSGGIVLGFARERQLGEDGLLDLNIAYNRRYGPFLSEEKREYWDVNATLTYNF